MPRPRRALGRLLNTLSGAVAPQEHRPGLRRRTGAALTILLAALLALPLAAATPAAAIGEATFTNPIDPDTADPTIEFHDGNYYMVVTTWDNRVVMRKAPTLAALGTTTPTTVYTDTNPGRNANMWAPELQRLNGPNGWRWYLMYTMGAEGNFDQQHLQVIESAGDDPMGPYTYKGRPVPTDRWNIDGAYLELNGELFMMWSAYTLEGVQSNYIARMSDPWTTTGPLNILSQPTEPWESVGSPVNEGPIPLQKDGRTWVVYSASHCYTDDYQLGTLEYDGTGDPVLSSSWTKSDGPVFSQANGEYGTGHNDFFDSPDGTEMWNLYHANSRPGAQCFRERSARAHVMAWTVEGDPDFGTPLGTAARIPVPSGENAPITARVEGAPWQLVSRSTGQCLTLSPTAAGEGAAAVQGPCTSPRANWTLDPTGDGFLRVVNANSGKALRPAGCSTASGASLEQAAWVTTSCQQWTVAPGSDGYSTLTSRASGKLLDGAQSSVRQSTATGASSQEWSLRPSGPVAVTSFVTAKSFDLPECSTADGAVLQQYDWLGSPCQRVTFTPTGAGSLEMHPQSATTKCLTVTGASTADGATVAQGPCGATGSSWRVLPRNDGTVELRASHSGKALDLADCASGNGARFRQWSVLNNDCQRFRISLGAPEAVTPTVAVTTSTRCISGRAVVTVTATNKTAGAVSLQIGTAFGSKSVAELASGKSTAQAFTTRAVSVPAADATVTATGSTPPNLTSTTTAGYPATRCG